MEIQGASAELNPNSGDLPNYGTLSGDPVRDDQQVMGAQSIATAVQNIQEPEVRGEGPLQGFLDLDGEKRPAPFDQARGRDDGQEPRAEQRNPEAPLNGVGPRTPSRGVRHSRVGALFSEVTAAVQGVVKAPPVAKIQARPPTEGPGSAGTEGTVRTGASGYVTAVSEAEAADGIGPADVDQDFGGQAPLFSEEQAQRLESMTKAAPLLYQASGSAPELPHSVSSDSGAGEIIQQEVRRQLQQFVNVQTELERRVVLLQRENEELRRGVGPGMDQGVRGWLGGISRGIMGFVQQVPAKAGHSEAFAASTITTVSHTGGAHVQPGNVPLGVLTSAQSPGPGVPHGILTPALSLGNANQVPGAQASQVAGQLPHQGSSADVAQSLGAFATSALLP